MTRPWRGVPLLLLLLAGGVSAQQDEFHTSRLFLKSKDAFSQLSSGDWAVKENDSIIAAARFRSDRTDGTILDVRAVREGATILQMRLSLRSSRLHVDVVDGEGLILTPKETDHVPLSPLNMTSSIEHSIGVRLHPHLKRMTYSFEKENEIEVVLNRAVPLGGSQLEVVMGSRDSSSLQGCLTLVSVTTGEPVADVDVVDENDVGSCAKNNHECMGRDCGKGKCLELETPTCDCFGTGMSGPNCKENVATVALRSTMDDTIRYTPIHTEQAIQRIAMKFKLQQEEGSQPEGVLLSAHFVHGPLLTVYVVEGSGTLQLTPGRTLHFHLPDPLAEHSLLLRLQDNEIVFTMDGSGEERLSLDCDGVSSCTAISQIRYGSDIQDGGAKRIGITACVKEVYADEKDVLAMLNDGDPRVSALHSLGPCEGSHGVFHEAAVQEPLAPAKLVSSVSDEKVPVTEAPEEKDPMDDVKTGGILPKPASRKPERRRGPCENSVGYKCKNGAICNQFANKEFECVCSLGFSGKYCQFSLLPRSCAEASAFHGLPDGPTAIDTDSSLPVSPSVAECTQGTTTVINDMPNDTVVHDTTQQHSVFHLSYRDFNGKGQLEGLIGESEVCRQAVSYSCTGAALGLSKGKTKWKMADGVVVEALGSVPHTCNGGRCNCEGEKATGVDDAEFSSPHVGVKEIVAYRDNSIPSQHGKMTIGSLQCTGHPRGSSPIRFSTPSSVLLPQHFNGPHLSFHFRTEAVEGVLLSTQNGLSISLQSQYSVMVVTKTGAAAMVETPSKLNDTAWHLVVVEVVDGEIRLSVDSSTAVYPMADESSLWGGAVELGHPTKGFLGCLRSLRIGTQVVDLHAEAARASGEVDLSCASKCTPSLCHNGAECVENLVDSSSPPRCSCRLPDIQSGASCEIDINVDSAISIHGGHLKYEDLAANPLTDQIVLSFRTDQQQALILFTHDHLNNFLQLHLASETVMSLSLNNEDEAETCLVVAPPGDEYSNMEWVQIIVSHSEKGTTLSVNGRVCSIHRPRQLSLVAINTYKHASESIVTIPVGLQSPTNPQPFVFTFVGGVADPPHKDGSLHLRPKYTSFVPDFLGCLRGLRVGGAVIDLKHTTKGIRPADPDLIRNGCELGCEALACGNGGHCGVAWTDFTPGGGDHTKCNCERTSYEGDTCEKDDALTLKGGHSVIVDMADYLGRYPGINRNHYQTLKFAFTANGQPRLKQTIATVFFKDDGWFEVLLNRNGSINVALWSPSRSTEVRTFTGNYSDGFRHFLVAQFKSNEATAVMIDSTRHDFDFNAPNLDLFDSSSLVVGTPMDKRFADAERENYEGCVSNLEIDFQFYGAKLRPIASLLNPVKDKWTVTSIHPNASSADLLHLSHCGSFEQPNHLPGLSPRVIFPLWDSNFGRQVYPGTWEQGEEQGSSAWWIILLLLLIAVVVIGVVIYCLCCKNKGDKKRPPPKRPEENVPLRPLVVEQKPQKPTNNYSIPKPDADLDPIDKISLSTNFTSKSDAYFTAPEYQSESDEDWDKTVTQENMGGTFKRPDDLEYGRNEQSWRRGPLRSVLVPPVERAVPNRVSSFRGTDPTVPRGSPLYGGLRTPMVSDPRSPIPPPGERRSPKPVPPPRISTNPSNV